MDSVLLSNRKSRVITARPHIYLAHSWITSRCQLYTNFRPQFRPCVYHFVVKSSLSFFKNHSISMISIEIDATVQLLRRNRQTNRITFQFIILYYDYLLIVPTYCCQTKKNPPLNIDPLSRLTRQFQYLIIKI